MEYLRIAYKLLAKFAIERVNLADEDKAHVKGLLRKVLELKHHPESKISKDELAHIHVLPNVLVGNIWLLEVKQKREFLKGLFAGKGNGIYLYPLATGRVRNKPFKMELKGGLTSLYHLKNTKKRR